MQHRLHEVSRRRRVVVARVRDAQASARTELARFEAELVAQLHEQPEHDVHRVLVSAQSEDLRPRGARLDREPELGVELAGGDVVVRVRFDARGETQHHGGATAIGDDLTQEVELVLAVDDDGGPGPVGRLQVLDALVVAEEMDTVGRKIRFQRQVQLAGGDDVESEALLGNHAKEPRRRKGFGRVQDLPRAAHRGHVLGRPLADGRLVVDVERSAMSSGQLDEVAAAHRSGAAGAAPAAATTAAAAFASEVGG
ncbi:MAG: hypothetical protein AUG05_07180 [Actinobacteria bacterium 13_1_20CM_2_66_18]|nr:MAG: hypothetical protein AUG05_07180 [Actinobacteria bacterium 13_1_20CM_2_66_18]